MFQKESNGHSRMKSKVYEIINSEFKSILDTVQNEIH